MAARRGAVGRGRGARLRVAFAPAILGALLGPAAAADPLGPGAGPWSVESPEAHGLDPDRVRAAVAHIFGSPDVVRRDCVLLVKDGALVYEAYRSEEYNETAHIANSVTKTLGALIAGWAQTRGLLDIDADITEAYGVRSPLPYPVTARQIMSQALAGNEGPGEKWEYDAAGTMWINTMPQVVENATGGLRSSEIWQREFAGPLGLSAAFEWPDADYIWAAGSKGTCRDYARVGQLLLNGGRWKGAPPIVSSEYVGEMHTPQTRYAPYANYTNPCYGLLTWLNTNPGSDRGSKEYPGICQLWPERAWFPKGSPSSVYLAAGLKGQMTMVIPTHNLVVVSMGDTPDDYSLERVIYEGLCMMFPGECSPEADSLLVV